MSSPTLNENIIQESEKNNPSVIDILELLVRQAYEMNASDIHIDPFEAGLLVRFRIDGVLETILQLPKSVHNSLFSRIKIISNLRIDEHVLPQDGRFSTTIGIVKIDVRVSIAPTYHGENAVLRILFDRNTVSLEQSGFSNEHIQIIKEIISRSSGLILITGPTGSGKTSSLYSCLQILNTGHKSIVTIEEPIEYAISGIVQIPANSRGGLSFAEGLRSILRQDPNVIGIGEVRDSETASLAVHSALTGHLVLTTLHASNAAGAIPRITSMGVEPYLISSTVTLIINQRLARKLCSYCSSKKALSRKHIEILKNVYSEHVEITDYFFSKGCTECNGTGSSGRIGVFELLVINDQLRDAINNKSSKNSIESIASTLGIKNSYSDAFDKVCTGLISIDEVMKIPHE